MPRFDLTVTVVRKRKSLSDRARAAGMRVVPMVGDAEEYRRALDYFVAGYLRGHRAAAEAVKRQRGKGSPHAT